MTSSAQLDTVSELLSDIRAMESLVRYYENRILRKRIAIEEIIHGVESRLDLPEPASTAVPVPPAAAEASDLDQFVQEKVATFLAAVDGQVFWYSDITKQILALIPAEDEAKIRHRVYAELWPLIQDGRIKKVPHGLQHTPNDQAQTPPP